MLLRWQLYRSPKNLEAQAVVAELWHRLRALDGLPVELMVVQPGKVTEFDVVVICRSRAALTWCWLAYDCLTESQRKRARILPYTLAEAKKDPVLADLLREFLGWKGRSAARRDLL